MELVRPIDKANNDKPKNFCFLTFDREEVAKKLVKEGECTIKGEKISIKRVTPKEGQGGFGGGWGYADPYAGYGGYGGYGGGYADPYAGYGGYGGGYGGGWGGDFGNGGGKMARGGAPRGRGRGRGGRPY